MAIKINEDTCIGCGLCASMCEEVFEMDDNTMKAKVKVQKDDPCVQESIDSCPVDAISK